MQGKCLGAACGRPVLAMADRRLSKDAAWDVAVAYQDREGKLETLLLLLRRHISD